MEECESVLPDNTSGIAAGHYLRRFRRVNAFTSKNWGKPGMRAGFDEISKNPDMEQAANSLRFRDILRNIAAFQRLLSPESNLAQKIKQGARSDSRRSEPPGRISAESVRQRGRRRLRRGRRR
jgi:hypothetical protein